MFRRTQGIAGNDQMGKRGKGKGRTEDSGSKMLRKAHALDRRDASCVKTIQTQIDGIGINVSQKYRLVPKLGKFQAD